MTDKKEIIIPKPTITLNNLHAAIMYKYRIRAIRKCLGHISFHCQRILTNGRSIAEIFFFTIKIKLWRI